MIWVMKSHQGYIIKFESEDNIYQSYKIKLKLNT